MSYFGRVTLIYIGGIVLCAVLLTLLAYVSEVYLDFPISSNSTAVVGVIVPAMMAGMSFVRRIGTRPLPREMWGLSLWFAVIQATIAAVILWAIGYFRMPETIKMTEGENFLTVASIGLVLVFAVLVLVSRLGLGIGVRNGLKQLQHAGAS